MAIYVDLCNSSPQEIIETLQNLEKTQNYEIDLSENNPPESIWPSGFITTILSLLNDINCKGLNFESNENIGDSGIIKITDFVKNKPEVEKLLLGGTHFSQNGLNYILRHLANHPSLKELDLQECVECNSKEIDSILYFISTNNILNSLSLSNLVINDDVLVSRIIDGINSNTSLEEFLLFDTYVYQEEAISLVMLRNKMQKFKLQAFDDIQQKMSSLERILPLHLLQKNNGDYSILNNDEFLIYSTENIQLATNRYFHKTLVLNDNDLLCNLIDKFLYKIKHYEKYERDFILGYKTQDQDFIIRFKKYLDDIMFIAQAINYIHPRLITREIIQYWKILSIESDADGSNRVIKEEVLRPFQSLITYLNANITRTGHHYGDNLSSDSDAADNEQLISDEITAKKQQLVYLRELQHQDENFGFKTWRTSVNHRGLEEKLNELLSKINNQEITNPETVVVKLNGIASSFNRVKLNRAQLPSTPLGHELVDRFNNLLLQRENGHISENDFNRQILAYNKYFTIPQFRGINYMIDRWNADSRRYHRNVSEIGYPMFSESVLKTLPFCFYTQLNEVNDVQRTENQDFLKKEANQQSKFLQNLNDSGFCVAKLPTSNTANLYLFNSIADWAQTSFSNGINQHLMYLRTLQTLHGKFWRRYATGHLATNFSTGLPNAYNYAIATGDRPLHALYYALGDKSYYRYPLQPRYNENGSIEYIHAGKIYSGFCELGDFFTRQVNRVSLMYKQGYVQLREGFGGVAPEKETSLLAYIAPEKIIDQFVIKFPSFEGEHTPVDYIKYGFTNTLYNSFKALFTLVYHFERQLARTNIVINSNNNVRKAVISLLNEWLTSYWEVMLLKIAYAKAQAANKILVYINWDGRLSFNPDPGNLHTQGVNNQARRDEANARKKIREKTAEQLMAEQCETDEQGFKIFSSPRILQSLDRVRVTNPETPFLALHRDTLFYRDYPFSSTKRVTNEPLAEREQDTLRI